MTSQKPTYTPDLVFQKLPKGEFTFPEGFKWGAATSAYQIEGHGDTGMGESVCDMVTRMPGKTLRGDNGTIACQHIEHMEEDVALMKEMGLHIYRFSTSWPRILPDGRGKVSEKGLGFYDRLTDQLLEAGITPWCTLFHWDFPMTLFRLGGWSNPDSPQWFADYAEIVVKRLGDRVTNWLTLNEPQVFVGLGHEQGVHAPGLSMERAELLNVAHNTLLAHGRAVQVIRAHSPKPARIGWAPVGVTAVPASMDPADIAAAKEAMLGYPEKPLLPNPWDETILWNNIFWADPVVFGDYPQEARTILGKDLPEMTEADRAIIQQPIDFYGANIYHGKVFRSGADGKPEVVERPAGYPLSAFKWPITPEALYWGPRFLYERYKLPIVVTENGTSSNDWVDTNGEVNDPARIDFTHRYLHALHGAIQEGIPVEGYFHWSLFDNYEWGSGYQERFGMIHVDYQTQKRTLKASAKWYKQVIQNNGI